VTSPSDSSVNLDVLRAVAVSTVLVDHFVPTLDYRGLFASSLLSRFTNHLGHAGVLAFFVHTSLVLMYSLERLERDGQPIVRRFYLRRFFRIYPLSIFCVLVVLVCKVPSSTWKVPDVITWRVIAANLLLVQNVVTGQSIISPLWSLPYEVQMYVVLPLLYLLTKQRRALLWLPVLIGCFALLGLGLSVTVGKLHMANYVPCFLAGVLCYALRKKVRPIFPAALWAPFVLLAVMVYCLIHLSSPRPIYWVGWLYCLALAGAVHLFRQPGDGLLATASNKIATYSYGLYLWHVPVLYLLFFVLPPMALWAYALLFLTLTAVASIVTFHLIESPLMQIGRKLSSRISPNVNSHLAPT
jgi:peptidoglycan/LPS O-acetylase OafA/YrhL